MIHSTMSIARNKIFNPRQDNIPTNCLLSGKFCRNIIKDKSSKKIRYTTEARWRRGTGVASLLLTRRSLDDIRITWKQNTITLHIHILMKTSNWTVIWSCHLPGSIILRQQTRKYFPQAVPRSTLSGKRENGVNFRTVAKIVNCLDKHNPISKYNDRNQLCTSFSYSS